MGKLTRFIDYAIEQAINAFPKSDQLGSARRGAELLLLADLADANPAALAEHLDLIASAPESNDRFAITHAAAHDVLVEHLHERHAKTFTQACALLKTPQALHLCILAYGEHIANASRLPASNPCGEIDLASGKPIDPPSTPFEDAEIEKLIPIIRAASGLAQAWTSIHQGLGSPALLSLSGGMALLDISAAPLDILSASISKLACKIPQDLKFGASRTKRSATLQDSYLSAMGLCPDESPIKACSVILSERMRPISPEEIPAIAEARAIQAIIQRPAAKSAKPTRL